ncbi:MAG: quinohemoprotein amine dehydrogenase subunit alpha [Sphingomonas taxi]|uniref:Quinohemoprotein amine dehydrogenase subunit alpha n=1 Tax=Sphingomonas taxi TaxID=1549858 RepID=A0A2W5P9P7_9SPHN|nr:MAG: quinohemoprotein amine dehydrogenase subunit alpha [Sphingomonas taxi]
MTKPSKVAGSRQAEKPPQARPGSRRWRQRLILAGLGATMVAVAQANVRDATPPAVDAADPARTESEDGIPVTDALTTEKCGTCHTPDAKGNLSRISWLRTTPEGWSQAIKRMVRLNGLQITPAESRAIVRYLAGFHGLSPEEARPVMYLPERRIVDEATIPNDSVRQACASCHAFAQPLSWRRSRAEWKLLQDMHVAMYSQAEAQYRRAADPAPGTPPAAPGTPAVTNGQIALEYLQKAAPLRTLEWGNWRPRIRPPYLAGTWLVSAHLPGRGDYVGELTIRAGRSADEFVTDTTLRSLTGGETLTRHGAGLVYGGYSWRGRSAGPAPVTAADDPGHATRETMWFAPDQMSAEGRWFWGEYHEFGFDVKLVREGSAPVIAAVASGGLRAGATNARVHVFGAHLPTDLTPADISLGDGVFVRKVESAAPGDVAVLADVAADAVSGRRDIGIRGATLPQSLPVYHRIDYMKVLPETGLARLGGAKFPRGYGQFEAYGYENGPDGKPNTPDDVTIGPVDADWRIDEFQAVQNDDDKQFVGTLSRTALFTPAAEGPNPARRFGRNNYGDVWVVATARTEKDRFGQPLTARAYLVVSVPAYQRWDQPEVAP